MVPLKNEVRMVESWCACWWVMWCWWWCALSLQSSCQWSVLIRVSPEVHHNLFCLLHFEGQVVCTTPCNQLCHLLSVGCFTIVADEAYHSCIISKLDDLVGAELGSAVNGSAVYKSSWLSTQPCEAPVLEVMLPTRTDSGHHEKFSIQLQRVLLTLVGLVCC